MIDFSDHELLVFDFGNTLLNSADNINNTWRGVLVDFDIDPDQFLEIYHGNYFMDEGAYCTLDKLEWTLQQMGNPSKNSEQMLDIYQTNYLQKCRKNLNDDPFGTWKVIDKLSNKYRMGILSDNSEYTKQKWMVLFDEYGMSDLFEFFITSERVGYWKPHRKMFESLKEYVDGDVKKIYFGNNLNRDAPSSNYSYDFVYVYGHDDDDPIGEYVSIPYIDEESMKQLGLIQ